MTLDLFRETGVPLDRQLFDWRDLVRTPTSKLDDDAFTHVRVILMTGIESEAVRFSHACARKCKDLQLPLARVRRVDHFQQILVDWLMPADLSPLETTIAYEQTEIEVTAAVAQVEADPYLAQVYRIGLLEDLDHLYRFSALLDRLEGKDANNIVQSYTDIRPGRATRDSHRAPFDDLRLPYDRDTTEALSKMHALLITAVENQTLDYYRTIGPQFADPTARQLYAEIATLEEQHVTQCESLSDADETWLEKWLLHEATEVYAYYSCLKSETNPRIKEIWQRFVDYELGQLHYVMDLFTRTEKRDPAEILPTMLPTPIDFSSHRDFVRKVLHDEVNLRAIGPQFVDRSHEGPETLRYRDLVNQSGSPSQRVAAGYRWMPGTEVMAETQPMGGGRTRA